MTHVDALSRASIREPNDIESEVLDNKLEVFLTLDEEQNVIASHH